MMDARKYWGSWNVPKTQPVVRIPANVNNVLQVPAEVFLGKAQFVIVDGRPYRDEPA